MTSRPRRRSRKLEPNRRTKPGAAPGMLATDPRARCPEMTLIAYGPDQFSEEKIDDLDKLRNCTHRWPVVWLNVDGLGDAATLQRLGEMFSLHALALEDVVNVHQRAKVEEYGEHLFIVARMVELCENRLETEQLSIYLGKRCVLTFQERAGGDSLEPVRERLRKAHGKIRDLGPDYLAYSLLDAVIDGYFPVLEHYGELLDDLEDEATLNAGRATLQRIHGAKVDLLETRRALWPHRDALNALIRDPNPLVQAETRVYLRDCYDHTVQLIDLVETYRELGADLRDLYLSSVSNRMNEVMKVLTVISTIFIPLSFIASVYGMNFDTKASPFNMPELEWTYGYPAALLLMLSVGLALVYFFWRKGWLESFSAPVRERRPLIPLLGKQTDGDEKAAQDKGLHA